MICFFVASRGNEFMAHIAELFAAGLTAIGVRATVETDGQPGDAVRRGDHAIVVAPHEYFPLHFLKTRPTIELEPTLASVAVLNVEQPGSQWFETAFEFARRARVVMDISPAGQNEFERRGVPAALTPLGYAPMLESARASLPTARRALDVLFFGSSSRRRSAFFARHARFFGGIEADIRFVTPAAPSRIDGPGYVSGAARSDYVASARIVLGVHSSESDYFEQHRALLALANGALFITEPADPPAPLVAGTHFVTGALDDLPALCEKYLRDPDALEAIARAGHERARSAMTIERGCRAMLAALEQTASQTQPGEAERRGALRLRIADAAARAARGEVLWSSAENQAYASDAQPAVTVVVTVFNYERFLPQCLASVATAEHPSGGIELIVVDDASADASASVAEAFMNAASVPTRVIRKAVNTGLSDTRNLGLALARGRYVFVLDADNWILPSCLRVLHAALEGGRHAAAYGILARVDDGTGRPTGLVSEWPWDPERLVAAPYIDAMALFDRDAVAAVGGYSTDLLEYGTGWEDYDLWLALAAAGRSVQQVPRIVGMYRDHRQSMLAETRKRSRELGEHLRRKYDALVQRYPGQSTYFTLPADESTLPPEQRETNELRAQIRLLELELAAMHASASWRATAPVRRVAGWMAGRGNRHWTRS